MKRLIPGLETADARTFGADHSVVGVLSISMTCLYCAVRCCAVSEKSTRTGYRLYWGSCCRCVTLRAGAVGLLVLFQSSASAMRNLTCWLPTS